MTQTPSDGRQVLEFESDKGSTRSRWVAGALAVAIIAWMGSGYILPSAPDEAAAPVASAPRAVSVAVRQSAARTVEQVFVAEGQALPDRDTIIRAETSGQIETVLVDKGIDLQAGQVIARFDTSTRRSDRVRAEEERARAQREFDNAVTLLERGVATVDRVAQARATLAAAEASLSAAQEALENTEIRAPFAGRLEGLDIDDGEFISVGGEIGRVVDNTPLTIRIQIPQQSLEDVKVGQQAEVSFITGAQRTGVVRFVGTSADAATRTFLAEIEVANEDGAIPAGISAQLRIPTGTLSAHFVSPAILSLDTDGTLGIKTVDDANVVNFHAVDIVRAQTDGIWVSGLPDQAQIISIGQGFVNDGETVNPQPDPDADAESGAVQPAPTGADASAAAPAPGETGTGDTTGGQIIGKAGATVGNDQ